jgi:adenine C2-methylase RlmN of 23S rRNA A2503 and tRNA A37
VPLASPPIPVTPSEHAVNLLGCDRAGSKPVPSEIGEKRFRASQLSEVDLPARRDRLRRMTNLGKALREQLAREMAEIRPPEVVP